MREFSTSSILYKDLEYTIETCKEYDTLINSIENVVNKTPTPSILFGLIDESADIIGMDFETGTSVIGLSARKQAEEILQSYGLGLEEMKDVYRNAVLEGEVSFGLYKPMMDLSFYIPIKGTNAVARACRWGFNREDPSLSISFVIQNGYEYERTTSNLEFQAQKITMIHRSLINKLFGYIDI